MASQLATKGPLASALSQWLFIGFGTVVIFSGDNGVTQTVQNILRLVGGSSAALLRDASSSTQNLMPQQPIVIHNVPAPLSASGSNNERGGWRGAIIQFSMGAGACWISYVVFSQLLPESIKELLPVTRQFFDQAVTSLGQGIIRVRDVLSEQIAALGLKQDELSAKQDSTHDAVNGLKKDIGDVRLNLDDIAIAISRCESSLSDASGRQTYMSKGIRLLVQCVGDLLRNSNPSVADELEQFSKLSDELDGEYHYNKSSGSQSSTGTPPKRSKMDHYPSSPKLSEIGSVSEIAMEDVRPMSLGPSHALTSPPISSSVVPPSPSPFMQSPPLMGKPAMISMRSMSISRQGSCPENEVPAALEKESFVRLDDVDQLLASIRSGAI